MKMMIFMLNQQVQTSLYDETMENKLNRLGKFNYANIDYVLLGLIIEKYDNTTWKSSVQNRIIDKVINDSNRFFRKRKIPK